MVGLYFSGTGNSKYCVERFLRYCAPSSPAYSIEDTGLAEALREQQEIVFGYPVQYSNLPKMLRDFVEEHPALWQGKHIYIIATMGLFSGDGAGVLARLLSQQGAVVTGGSHIKMPDSICDEKALKRPPDVNRQLFHQADIKLRQAAERYKKGRPAKEGLGSFCHLAGLFGQRLYFRGMTQRYSDKLKIDPERCTGCGTCTELCPMDNITLDLERGRALPGGQCTMCYRCINRCPVQAITLLGKEVMEPYHIEEYL